MMALSGPATVERPGPWPNLVGGIDVGESKACTECQEVKPLSEFDRSTLGRQGRTSKCKRCRYELYYRNRKLAPLTPEQRARKNQLASAPERRARKNAEKRERYHTDPEFRARYIAYMRARERDPAYKASRRRYKRDRLADPAIRAEVRAIQRAADAAIKFGERVHWRVMDAIAQKPCFGCGKTPAGGVDHIIPHVRGGRNIVENLQPACLPCNSSKGAR